MHSKHVKLFPCGREFSRSTALVAVVATVSVLVLLSTPASADTKTFAYTYPAATISKGDVEVEHYLDMGLQGWDDPSTDEKEEEWTEVDWKHQIELEYGITNAWDLGFYNVFKQKPYGSLAYDGLKLRSRYNFGEGRDWIINPGLYLEVGYFGDAVKWEEMIILSAEAGIFETSLNFKGEQKMKFGGDENAMEYEAIISYAAGLHLGSWAALSLEYYGKVKFKEGEMDYFVNYIGPTLHIDFGRFYWNIAVQPQLGTRETLAAVRVRSLLAIMF